MVSGEVILGGLIALAVGLLAVPFVAWWRYRRIKRRGGTTNSEQVPAEANPPTIPPTLPGDESFTESLEKPSAAPDTPLLIAAFTPRPKRRCCPKPVVYGILFVLWFLALVAVLAILFKLEIWPHLHHDNNPPPAIPKYRPEMPEPPNATNVTRTSVHLTWKTPRSTGSMVRNYTIEESIHTPGVPLKNMTFVSIFKGPTLSLTLTDLFGNLTYCFRVNAINVVGPSKWSNHTCVTTEDPAEPTPPALITPHGTGVHWIALDWGMALYNGAVIDEYTVEGKRDEIGFEWKVRCDVVGNQTLHCNATKLEEDRKYKFRVRAHNTVGWGPWSPEFTFSTNGRHAKVPGKADPVKFKDVKAGSVTILWEPVKEDGGAEILEYTLQRNVSMDKWLDVGLVRPGHPFEVIEHSLMGNTVYCWRVDAVNSIGEGPFSDPACTRTKAATAPDAPKLDPYSHVTSTTIDAKWSVPDANGGPIQGYTLQRTDWWVDQPLHTIYQGNHTTYTASEHLMPSVAYNFRVRAHNMAGEGEWSAVVNYTTDEAGNCGNPSDTTAYKATKKTMKGSIQLCIIGCAIHGRKCVAPCIHNKVGLSLPCAECWAEEGQCTLSNCATPCLNPTSAACAKCSEDKCFPACVACSGIPRYFFPP